MQRVFGLETEYGITIEGAENVDVVAESIALVRSYMERGALMKWDYALEDPHSDARGFRAAELSRIRTRRPISRSIGIGRSVFKKSKATSCWPTAPSAVLASLG